MKKKLFPKNQDVKVSMRDEFGNNITSSDPLKNLYLKTYIE